VRGLALQYRWRRLRAAIDPDHARDTTVGGPARWEKALNVGDVSRDGRRSIRQTHGCFKTLVVDVRPLARPSAGG